MSRRPPKTNPFSNPGAGGQHTSTPPATDPLQTGAPPAEADPFAGLGGPEEDPLAGFGGDDSLTPPPVDGLDKLGQSLREGSSPIPVEGMVQIKQALDNIQSTLAGLTPVVDTTSKLADYTTNRFLLLEKQVKGLETSLQQLPDLLVVKLGAWFETSLQAYQQVVGQQPPTAATPAPTSRNDLPPDRLKPNAGGVVQENHIVTTLLPILQKHKQDKPAFSLPYASNPNVWTALAAALKKADPERYADVTHVVIQASFQEAGRLTDKEVVFW